MTKCDVVSIWMLFDSNKKVKSRKVDRIKVDDNINYQEVLNQALRVE